MDPWQKEKAGQEPKAVAETAKAAGARAVTRADIAHAQLGKFKRKIDAALELLGSTRDIGRFGVSFSGGKDSLVSLHLARRAIGDSVATAFFDSGAELDGTLQLVDRMGIEVIHPRMTMLDMARFSGWWGYEHPVDPGCPFDAKRVLIQEPCETWVVKRGLHGVIHGVRGEESGGRMMHTRSRGELYQGADRTWYCMPLARWTTQDVWAYIAWHELEYHPAYDALSAAGIPREGQRIGGALGERGSGFGRHAKLAIAEPETWHRLVREFPRIGLQ